jgi:hypothetical protein
MARKSSSHISMTNAPCRVAILSHRDRETREGTAPETGRFAKVFHALGALGAKPEIALYHDDCSGLVRRQLLEVDGVLVWVNPQEGDRDRSMLDTMLREVASCGVFVSAHPDVILKMGTKEVLYETRAMSWGCETHLYRTMEEMRRELPARLAGPGARVLKQYRGHSGDGVWKVELEDSAGDRGSTARSGTEAFVRVRHAKRGSTEEVIALSEFFARCEPYFIGQGRMIDQAYQPRLPEGMIRCYLVQDRVGGFGHQAINALCPALPGAPADETPTPTPRLYHPATLPQFQLLKRQLESEWVREMQRMLQVATADLPVLWDADFLLGPKSPSGEDSYVLCEINVSSVSPFPDSAAPLLARTTLDLIRQRGVR